MVRRLREAEALERQYTAARARALGLPLVTRSGARLVGFRGEEPIYEGPDNVNAAISTAASPVRQVAPFDADGAGHAIGLWESGGIPRATHREFGGRLSNLDSGTVSAHATHVAGTLAAAGVDPSVKGMAPAADIVAHDSTSETSEMAELAMAVPRESGRIQVSNHSYGQFAGWEDGAEWYGVFTDDGDPLNDHVDRFGRYTSTSRAWDGIPWSAPFFLPFKSGGNHRNDGPPSSGATWYLNGSVPSGRPYDPASHPLADRKYRVSGGVEGFDILSQRAVCKNVMTVGAVNDAVAGGVRALAPATLTSFSSFGPTDDGRIKPDIVANGSSLKSCDSGSDTNTAIMSGTSMSAPNACGSALLLIDCFERRFPHESMLASTLKGLVIHTADDLGNPGPDYRFGWGLMNTLEAAELLRDHASVPGRGRLMESELSAASPSGSCPLVWTGAGPIRVTLCWTDPPGDSTTAHDSRARRLVHDLNLRVIDPLGGIHLPYVMPWVGDWSDAKLDAAAVRGTNTVDNVEQVLIALPPAAGEYVVAVDHAGALGQGPQRFSLLASGATLPRGFGLWVAMTYPGRWGDPAVAGIGADPDGNGAANGIEYAFGIPHGAPLAQYPPYVLSRRPAGGGGTSLVMTFVRDLRKADVQIEAEWSGDLRAWEPIEGTVVASAGPLETVEALVPMTGGARFLRLRVTRL